MTLSVTRTPNGWAWWVSFDDGARYTGLSPSLPNAWQEIWQLKLVHLSHAH